MAKRPTIDEATGTTIDERRRIRKRHKQDKIAKERGIRSHAVTDAYRDGWDRIYGS